MAKKDEVVIAGRNIMEYLRLKRAGWRTAWTGEGKICLVRDKKKRRKKYSKRRNPLPRWVDRRSIRTIFRGKGRKRSRLLVGCPKGYWRRGRCWKGMRLVEKKRAKNARRRRRRR
jgi:hypothetical protein